MSDSLKILLVEDNEVNQLMAQGTLSHMGHQVTIASDGVEAVDKSAQEDFQLILMDLMMPNMDGFEASKTILERCEQKEVEPPPIVALTATLKPEDKERCRAVGMTRWLKKPIDPSELKTLLDTLGSESSKVEAPIPVKEDDLLSRIKDPQALANILELFRESYPKRLTELSQNLGGDSASTARRAAHTLKGNFLNFAAAEGASLAQELESAITDHQWEKARELLPDLEKQCREVEAVLSELVQKKSQVTSPPETEGSGTGFSVIVADVDPANRAICSAALRSEGYRVVEASDGEQVLQALAEESIDVVLMGVFMSNLDGFETCRRLKAADDTQMIPVLLVTAMDERAARITGMDAGADDFINKPIDPREVSLRVRNAARGKGLYDQLQTSFEELQQLEELRDGLTHMLVHDLRTPLTAIKGYASLLSAGFGNELSPQQKKFAEKILAQSNRLVEMVSGILDLSRLESDQMPLEREPTELSLLMYEQAEQFSGLPDCHLELEVEDGVQLRCDPSLVKRVVANLLSNAFKYTPKEEAVTLRLSQDREFAKIQILDKGPGVPEDLREKIFEKFAQVEGETHKRPYSSGLGLTFCQLVVTKHGGEIAVGEAPGGGADFWFTLPLKPVNH